MEYRSGLVAGISLAIVAVIAASAACSSSSTGSTTPANDSGIVPSDVCHQAGDYDSCKKCCHPSEGYDLSQQIFDSCMCQGACKTPCADSVCAADAGAAVESDECNNCLNSDPSATGCSQQAQASCDTDPDCTRAVSCINDACNSLPESDGGH